MDCPWQPTGTRVLFKQIETNDTTSHIVLPTGHQPEVMHGEVVAVGPGRMTMDGSMSPCQMHPGDHIVIDGRVPVKIKLGPEEFFLCDAGEIQAIKRRERDMTG